jgi:hypothetical protein
MKIRCNSCGGTYSDKMPDGTSYFHVCPPETIEHATFDALGKQTNQEKRTPRANVRDERPQPGLLFQRGVWKREISDPTNDQPPKLVDANFAIVSEGDGRTVLEP